MNKLYNIDEIKELLKDTGYVIHKSPTYHNTYYIYYMTSYIIEFDLEVFNNNSINLSTLLNDWEKLFISEGIKEEQEKFYRFYNLIKSKIRKNKIRKILEYEN